jgi:hypothetical protein
MLLIILRMPGTAAKFSYVAALTSKASNIDGLGQSPRELTASPSYYAQNSTPLQLVIHPMHMNFSGFNIQLRYSGHQEPMRVPDDIPSGYI